MIMTAIIQQLYSRHFHEVWFKFSYSCDLTIFLQLSLSLWIKAFLCILVLVVSWWSSLAKCAWSSQMLWSGQEHASSVELHKPLLCSLWSSYSCGFLLFYMGAYTTLTCQMWLFPQRCTTTTGMPVNSLAPAKHTLHILLCLSAGQAVSHPHLSCALIHWPMCLWQGTRSMYVQCKCVFLQHLYVHAIYKRFLWSKWVFRCWHSAKRIGSLYCWKCLILPSIGHWGCSWSGQHSTLRMEARLSPQLSLYVGQMSAVLLWYENEAKILPLCFDSLHHCCVLLRQDKCCRPPALVL